MKRLFKILMVIALIVLINPVTSYAYTNDGLFRADYDITVSDDMEGSAFLAGNMVTIKNKVDGILFTAGNVLNVINQSDYGFIAGSTINIADSKYKDLFIAGASINLENVEISRDLYVAGSSIKLIGNVGRNVFVAGDEVTIDGVINGDVYIDSQSIVINSNAVINGKLKYNDDAKIELSKDAIINEKSTYKNPNTESAKIDTNKPIASIIVSKLINALINFLNILVVGLLMVLLLPSVFNKLRELEANKLLPSFAWGLLILVAAPIISLIAMITFVGVSTGIIAITSYCVLLYISTILSTFTITSLIFKDKIKNPYLILLIGLVCLYVIKLIPFVGGLVTFAFICIGLGLITNIIKRK